MFEKTRMHSSFEFSQAFMNVLFLGENKERKLVLSFMIRILEIISFFIAFCNSFLKNICDSVKLTRQCYC